MTCDLDRVLLEPLARGQWRVACPLVVALADCVVSVPAGFVYDLASVPRPLWPVLAPFELGVFGPLVHDLLYRHGGALPHDDAVRPYRTFTRPEADRIFLELMVRAGVPRWRRWPAYLAVRAAGWASWRRAEPTTAGASA